MSIYRTQWTAEGFVFDAVYDFFVCLWNILGTAERICAKFTGKTCLVPCSDEFECQGQRSKVKVTRDKNGFFRPFQRPVCGLCLVKHLVQFPFSELRFDSWNFNRIRNGASSIRQPDTHKNRIIMLVDNSKARYTLPMSTDPVHGRIHGPWTRPVNTGIVCTELKVDLVIYSATNKQTWMSYISLNDTMTRILKFPVLIYLGVGLN